MNTTNIALFYVRNKEKIIKITKISLIVFDSVLFLSLLISFYFIFKQPEAQIRFSDSLFSSWQEQSKPKALVVSDITLISKSDGVFDVFFKINNNNNDFHAQETTYSVSLVDSSGEVYDRAVGKEYVLAGEDQVVVVSNLQSTKVASPQALVSLDTTWLRNKEIPKTELVVSGVVNNTPTEYRGIITNPYEVTAKRVIVKGWVLSGKEVVAVDSTVLYNLESVGEREFGLILEAAHLSQNLELEIKAEINPYE